MTEQLKPKKKEGRFMCRCDCGGEVRGVYDFGQWWTWCLKCTPVQTIREEDIYRA